MTTDKCPHCGSEEEPYFSRVVPMGYYCPDCGEPDEITREIIEEDLRIIDKPESKLNKWMISFVKFFTERTNVSKGCAMLYFDFPDMKEIHKMIDKKDIYKPKEYGLEDKPHCTLLYGFDTNVKSGAVFDVIGNFTIPKLVLKNASLFENEYDVLKFDVKDETKTLHKINKRLCECFPYENDYPNYHPHASISYLKKGTGKKYVNMLKGLQYEVIPDSVVYSVDGKKDKVKLTK